MSSATILYNTNVPLPASCLALAVCSGPHPLLQAGLNLLHSIWRHGRYTDRDFACHLLHAALLVLVVMKGRERWLHSET